MNITSTAARICALLAAALAGPAWAQPAEAYVLAVQGSWTTPGRALPVAVGTPLPVAARLVARHPAVGDRIVVIAARSGGVLLSRECVEPRACRDPLVVPPAPTPPTPPTPTWAESLRRAMGRLEGAPDRYVATLSRNDAALPDAVLALNGRRVDLAAVLAALPAARCELTLRRLDCTPASECAESSTTLDVAAGAGAMLVDTAGPGVYELRVRFAGGAAALAAARRSRLLLVPPELAAEKIERYRHWVALTERWGDAVDAGSRKSLLRALMDELAASQ